LGTKHPFFHYFRPKAQHSATTTSRAQVIQHLADVSRERAKNASLAGDHAAAEKFYDEANGYYKEFLSEMGGIAAHKHAPSSTSKKYPLWSLNLFQQ
jgi:hypothetical protein